MGESDSQGVCCDEKSECVRLCCLAFPPYLHGGGARVLLDRSRGDAGGHRGGAAPGCAHARTITLDGGACGDPERRGGAGGGADGRHGGWMYSKDVLKDVLSIVCTARRV